MARLVAFGDAHLGRAHLAHLRDEEGRPVREEDFLRSFDWAVEETLRLEPDGFLWLGDIFDHARPSYRVFARVLAGLQRLVDAGLPGAAISGNHDTPRLRGTGSPYDALERVFPSIGFAWRMEAEVAEIAGVRVHAVPQTLDVQAFKDQLERASAGTSGDATSLLIAHVALTSLPSRDWRDMNELEVETSAFAKRFDLVVLGHYHQHLKPSARTWYAGSTDSFGFGDRPNDKVGPKGLLVVDTDAAKVELVPNPHERPLLTRQVDAAAMGPAELLAACETAGHGAPDGAIVRIWLNAVDPAALRQLTPEAFQETVPGALHVQIDREFGPEALAVQGGVEIGTLESEWSAFVDQQDLAGLERARVRELGAHYLESARGEAV
ncbi:MAG: DNA repair exonuclease [Actinobacteria bacterium]|nr:DNA repair exonuclease [Actinomycetota bacterium]